MSDDTSTRRAAARAAQREWEWDNPRCPRCEEHHPPDECVLDLDAIRERADADLTDYDGDPTGAAYTLVYDDVPTLLAEVDRLRAERDLYREGIRKHRDDLHPQCVTSDDLALWSLLDGGTP